MYQFHFKGGVLKIAPEIPGVPWNTVWISLLYRIAGSIGQYFHVVLVLQNPRCSVAAMYAKESKKGAPSQVFRLKSNTHFPSPCNVELT
jgi:hypothetical protein